MAGVFTPTRKSPDLTGMLKVLFAGPLYNAVVQDSDFKDLFTMKMDIKTDRTTGGRYVEKSTQIRKGGGVGNRGEMGYLPEARRPKFVNPRINLRKLLTTVEITGDSLRLAKGSEEAFLDWAEAALPQATERLQHVRDRQFIGTGNGIMARVASKTATGVVLKDAHGIAGFTDAWLLFMEGDSIVFTSDAAGTTLRNAAGVRFAVVGNINEDTGELTLESADGTAVDAALLAAIVANDYIFLGDSAGTNAPIAGENVEIEGALAAVDDGGIVPVYHNITRSGNRLLQGNVHDLSGAALTEEALVVGDQKVRVRGGGKIDHLILSFAASNGYWNDQKGGNRFIDARGNYTGGQGKLEVVLGDRTIPFNIARKLSPELSFGLSAKEWERYSPGEVEWDDTSGAIFERVTDSTGRLDVFYAMAVLYENLHCNGPRKQIRFEGIDPDPFNP